jgi:Asp-tRNA(Asn)/Glu-tRNA(Gln) amidotransferase A subunit family amidase
LDSTLAILRQLGVRLVAVKLTDQTAVAAAALNYLGLPALVFPAGWSAGGLPIGIQLIGRPFADERLIALGAAFQAATDHHRKVPQRA